MGPATIAMLAIAGAALIALGPASGAASASGASASVGTLTAPTAATGAAPSGSWAWGALANLSLSVAEVGAYNATENLTGGNLTSSGAYVALEERAGYAYASYAIVNATSPSNSTRYVTVQAVELKGLALGIVAAGSFPVAGTYAPGAPLTLAWMNVSLAASIVTVSAEVAYLNFTTGPNGSLSLANEHVEAFRALNLSLAASNFPNATTDAQGNAVLVYNTGTVTASGWAFVDVSATFTPALPVVVGPLYVGETWSARSMAAFNGSAAYSTAFAASAPGTGTVTWSQAAAASVSATVPVALDFAVVGTQTVYFPDGSSETDYAIAYSNGSGNGGELIANGLAVLPSNDPNHDQGIVAAVPEHPAAARAASTAPTSQTQLYSPARGLPDSVRASPASGTSVTATPISPEAANHAMVELRAPTPSVPATTPTAHGPPVVAIALVAMAGLSIGALALVREVRRFRRTK